jgi:predicted RNase H-like HicB family nuclease
MEEVMRYPVYVHAGDGRHSHGIIIPDFPGCFTAADSWQDLPRAIQEAVEVYCDGETGELPFPSSIEELSKDAGYEDGTWLLADIDISRLSSTMHVPERLRQMASKPSGRQESQQPQQTVPELFPESAGTETQSTLRK